LTSSFSTSVSSITSFFTNSTTTPITTATNTTVSTATSVATTTITTTSKTAFVFLWPSFFWSFLFLTDIWQSNPFRTPAFFWKSLDVRNESHPVVRNSMSEDFFGFLVYKNVGMFVTEKNECSLNYSLFCFLL
jgi:hypothetical protein